MNHSLSMVRLQAALSKPNWQSHRPRKPIIYLHYYFYSRNLHLSATITRSSCRLLRTTRYHVSTEDKEEKMAHHAYINVRKEMLDRRRPIVNSPPPPTHVSLTSPHLTARFIIHTSPSLDPLTQPNFSIVLQIRAVGLALFYSTLPPSSYPMIEMPSLPMLFCSA